MSFAFFRAGAVTAYEDTSTVAIACEAWLSKAGHGADDDVSDLDDDGLGLFQAAAAGYSAVRGVPTPVARRVQIIQGKARALPPMCASCAGYNLHAGVAIDARDRQGLERLGRYLLRPPLAKTSLTQAADGSVVFEMKRAYSDGTAALRFTPEERDPSAPPTCLPSACSYRSVGGGESWSVGS